MAEKAKKSKWTFEIDAEACMTCATCEDECKQDAIYVEDYYTYAVNQDNCNGCSRCYRACPVDAVKRIPNEKAS